MSDFACTPPGFTPLPQGLTLADLHARYPHYVPEFWVGGVDPFCWWLCLGCLRCTLEPNLEAHCLYHEPGADSGPYDAVICCPNCEGRELYTWAGWPSRVVLGWTPRPNPARQYTLPNGVYPEPQEGNERTPTP